MGYIESFKQIFQRFDDDSSNDVDLNEFEKHLSSQEMVAFMSGLGLDPRDVRQFFCVLSQDGQCPVDMETFVIGCLKLQGLAKSMDLIGLANVQKQLTMRLKEQVQHCTNRIDALCDELSRSHPI